MSNDRPDDPPVAPGDWFVYVLECRDGSLYTGITTDVAARFAVHVNGKGARYTRAHPPQRVLAALACADRSTASSAEHAIKRLTPEAKRAWCAEHASGSAIEPLAGWKVEIVVTAATAS